MNNTFVIGLDLETMQEVHVNDRPVWEWRNKGNNGDKTLVCLHCFNGADLPAPRAVPLIPRGRIGGRNRSHFAHPAGLAHLGCHSTETWWHVETKACLRRWAVLQPGVVSAAVEHCTTDGRRRSDVSVLFRNGQRVALEVQRQVITDSEWMARHRDYTGAGITDVWLWHYSAGPPAVLYSSDQPGWVFDQKSPSIGVAYGEAQPAKARWWTDSDLNRYLDRWPPRPEDRIQLDWFPLKKFNLATNGLQPPEAFRNQLSAQAAEIREVAASLAATATSRARDSKQLLTRQTTGPVHADPMHEVQLVSAHPPWQDFQGHDLYFCRECGNLTGEQARADQRHGVIGQSR